MGAPTILVTGASGFVGSALIDRFRVEGWNAIAASRHRLERWETQGTPWRPYDLERDPTSAVSGCDVVVAAAYVQRRNRKDAFEVNFSGTRRLVDAARIAGVRQTIFLSSLAAHDGARSDYGRYKRMAETLFDLQRDAVVRPGLVIGHGGLFGSLAQHLRHSSVVPLVGGGQQPLQSVGIDELTDAVAATVAKRSNGSFTIAESPGTTYRRFFEYVAQRLGRRVRFVPVPGAALEWITLMAGSLFHNFPVDLDNVRGVRAMQFWEPEGVVELLGRPVRSFTENIDLIFASGATVQEVVR